MTASSSRDSKKYMLCSRADIAETSMEKIIVFRPGALGDTLLAFPALAALRRAFAGAWLAAIGNAPALALARDAGLIDEALPFDDLRWADLFSEDGIRSPETRQTLSGAHLALLWLRDSEGLAARNLRALGIARVLSAPGRPPEVMRIHAADYLLGTLAPILGDAAASTLAIPAILPAPDARSWAEAEWKRRDLADMPVLLLHPGSGGREKCWPPERFAELAGRFMAAGWRALVIEGPADEPAAAALLAALPAERAERVAGLTLPQLAALLARASGDGRKALYVGNDSGVSHLSALLGVPTLALFGPTDPAIWAPRGPRARVVWAGAAAPDGLTLPPMIALSVDGVYDAALAVLRSDC
jgi:heptosyltransferase-3